MKNDSNLVGGTYCRKIHCITVFPSVCLFSRMLSWLFLWNEEILLHSLSLNGNRMLMTFICSKQLFRFCFFFIIGISFFAQLSMLLEKWLQLILWLHRNHIMYTSNTRLTPMYSCYNDCNRPFDFLFNSSLSFFRAILLIRNISNKCWQKLMFF